MEFPVLEKVDEILDSIRTNQITILQAPPGSGKTTVLPLEILKAEILDGKKILILEPRRIAAKNAAFRLAHLNQSPVGKTIGFRIRFESKVSVDTKIEVVTDGILTKLLLADPELKDYGLIIFDEFHERNLDSDFCLALVRQVQSHFREDLRVLIMSATLEGIQFTKSGIDTPPIATEGKSFPVEIVYQGDSSKRQSIRIAELVPKVIDKHEGDLLIFFSGVSEINEAFRELLKTTSIDGKIIILKLYGDLNFEEQEKVFLPSNPGQRKIILATNLAESSVTISKVKIVIDTGYCKRAIFDPSSGLTRLIRKRISLASAKQRSGRSGREAPGITYRLWTKEEEENFVTTHSPEILEADISNLILLSKIWGEELKDLPLIDSPSQGTMEEMSELLRQIGCLDSQGKLTDLGKQASQLPIPLRLAVMCIRVKQIGKLELGVDLATCFSERRLLFEQSSILNFQHFWDKWLHLANLNAFPRIKLIRDQLLQNLKNISVLGSTIDEGIAPSPGNLLSLAFPDRISKSRSPGSNRYKMANGKGAYLLEGRLIHHPEWLLVLESDGDDTEAKINLYCDLTESAILSLHANQMQTSVIHLIEENEKKIPFLRSYEEHTLGEISLKKTSHSGNSSQEGKKKKIFEYFQKTGIANLLYENEEVRQLYYRIKLLVTNGLLENELSEPVLLSHIESWLYPNYSFEKENINLLNFNPVKSILALYTFQEREMISKEAPDHLTVPSGSKISINYVDGKAVLAVKLQEVFGLMQTPCIAKGRVPLTLHLLSPAGRPVQVTADLKNFWDSTYFEVRKELKGRYPKHPWPDSPWDAIATKGTKKRSLN